jgi:hypothetical protein
METDGEANGEIMMTAPMRYAMTHVAGLADY